MAEQIIGGPEPDVVTLQLKNSAPIANVSTLAMMTDAPPRLKPEV